MKVWHITRTLYGGAGIYAQRLSEALRSEGIDSFVLSEDELVEERSVRAGVLRPEAGKISQLATRAVRSMSHRLTSAPFHSLMSRYDYGGDQMPAEGDVIHLHGLTGWMGLRGLNTLIPEQSTIFWTTHDLWPLSGGCVLYSGCDGYRSDCGNCPILRNGTKYWAKIELGMKKSFVSQKQVHPVANSGWMAQHIEESVVFRGVKKIPVIPPIIDPAYLAYDIEDIRRNLEVDPSKKVIALGARALTDRYKGIPEFLEALAGHSTLAKQCVILLFGEGELELPGNLDVRLLGRLETAKEVARVYHSSDVFVSPSAMETFGMALAEAQACGTPVAAFDVGGVGDAVSEECVPFLVPAGNMIDLLNAVERVLERSNQTGGQWRVSRDWAKQKFEASVIAKKQMAVYAQQDCQLK